MKAKIMTPKLILQNIVIGASILVLAFPFAATPVSADDELALEEVVVTARKKEENLQDVPVSVISFSGEDIQERGMANLLDVGNAITNVRFEAGTTDVGGAANATFFIRGIGQLDYAPTIDQGVGLYVDGVYIGRAQGAVLELADIERIEVLKGPQGTLFGRNTMGGAINVTSVMPNDQPGGSAAVTVGEDQRFNVDVDLNSPLTQNLSARFAASYRSQDGYVDRPLAGDKSGEEGTFVGRAKFLYEPSDDTQVLASFDFTRIDADANVAILNYNQPAGLALLWNAFVGFPAGTPLTPEYTAPDLETSFSTGPARLKYAGGGLSLRIDHDFGPASFRSVTAYREFDSRNLRDNDGSPVFFGHLDYRDEQWQVSQEFNLFGEFLDSRIQYTAGLFYFEEESESVWGVNLAPGLYEAFEALPAAIFPLDPSATCPGDFLCAGGVGNPFNVAFDIAGELFPEVRSKSYAAFLDFDIAINERWTALLGGRLTRDEKDYSYFQSRFASGIPTVPLTETSDSWTNFSPRTGLTYEPNDDTLYYATVSTGYKAGGYNARPANPEVARRPFDPEELTAYEIGSKWDLMNNRVRLNTAFFYYDYKDMQLQANDLVGTQTVQVIDNIGASRLSGVEVDLQWAVSEGLTLMASVGYLNAEYKETQEQITGVSLDTKLPKAPEWSSSASLDYRTPLAGGQGLFRVDYSYVDESYADVRNTPELRQAAHSLVNARIAWLTADGDWTFAAYGRNIFDERYIINGFDVRAATGSVIAIPNEPRELGIQVIARF